MKQFMLTTLFCFLLTGLKAQELSLSLSGIVTFNETQLLVKEAGEDINAAITSNSPVKITVDSDYYWEMKNQRWRIYVHKSDIEWNDEINLLIRRSGKGKKLYKNGTPNINDGSSFFKVTNNPTYFFRGKGLIADIPLKFRVENLSLTMGANDFETDIIFTIYDN